jgi:energy-coupling factor transporter ATP-binding protein EcfA2
MGNELNWSEVELATDIQKTLQADKDFLIAITGDTGGGKSTLAVTMAYKISPNFNMETDIIFSREELTDRIYNAPKYSCIIVDEAINALFKRDAMKKEQKNILKLLDMCRDRNLCLIFCIPSFWALDKHTLQGRFRLRMHIERTGLAFIWKPTKNPFSDDPWGRLYNIKVTGLSWDKYPNAQATLGFVGFIRFGDLPKYKKDTYLEVKKRKKQELRDKDEAAEKKMEQERRENTLRVQALTILKLQGIKGLPLGSLQEFCRREGLNYNSFTDKLSDLRKELGQVVNDTL